MSSLAHWGLAVTPPRSPEGPERAIELVAARFVRTWGFTTVNMVAWRFRLLSRTGDSRIVLARRALERLPDICWLDPTCEWFSLLDRDSPLKAAIAKILSVAGDVDRDELGRALGKRHQLRDAPPIVIQTYLTALLDQLRASPAIPARLSHEERALVAMLRAAGGSDDLPSLRRQVDAQSLEPLAVIRALHTSPLFLRTSRGTYRLVGSPLSCAALIPSRAWQAAV
jgi:hypothetical protein